MNGKWYVHGAQILIHTQMLKNTFIIRCHRTLDSVRFVEKCVSVFATAREKASKNEREKKVA